MTMYRSRVINQRRIAVMGFAVVASILLLASSVYACTFWLGRMVVTGYGATPGSVETQSHALTHGYCYGPTGTANVDDSTSGTVGITVSATNGNCWGGSGYKLMNVEHRILWSTGTWANDAVDCMTSTGTDIGAITPDASGNATTTSASFTGASELGRISVCVDDGSRGNQVPLTVL